jgi:bile acid:Na+ symporter, BASS family
MFQLATNAQLLVLLFLVTAMLSVGMQTHVSDLRAMLSSRKFLTRLLLANFVVVPIVGVAIALLLPLQRPVAGALVLLACTPGGLSALNFTTKVAGRVYLAGAAMCLLALLALLISPLLLKLVLPAHVDLAIPYGRYLGFILIFLLLPLLAGMLLLAKAPAAAMKLSKPLGLVSLVVFISFMVVSGAARKAAAGEIGVVAVAAILLFIVVSMAIGWFMGGPTRETRQVLATCTGIRNVVLCMAIVHTSAPEHAVLVPLFAFSLLMVPPDMLFTIYCAVQAKRRARKVAAASV